MSDLKELIAQARARNEANCEASLRSMMQQLDPGYFTPEAEAAREAQRKLDYDRALVYQELGLEQLFNMPLDAYLEATDLQRASILRAARLLGAYTPKFST